MIDCNLCVKTQKTTDTTIREQNSPPHRVNNENTNLIKRIMTMSGSFLGLTTDTSHGKIKQTTISSKQHGLL